MGRPRRRRSGGAAPRSVTPAPVLAAALDTAGGRGGRLSGG